MARRMKMKELSIIVQGDDGAMVEEISDLIIDHCSGDYDLTRHHALDQDFHHPHKYGTQSGFTHKTAKKEPLPVPEKTQKYYANLTKKMKGR